MGAHRRFDNQGGAEMQVTRLSEIRGSSSSKFDRRCTISAIKDEGLGTNAQPAYVQVAWPYLSGKRLWI